MKVLYEIFNSPSMIHMKFMKLQLYVIKRLTRLAFYKDEYSADSGGRDTLYHGNYWSEALPSDSELIASIFCHLLDIAYYGQYPKDSFKYYVPHLLNSS